MSAGLLRVLGVDPLLGRSFSPEDDQRGAGDVVMLTYHFWTQRFGADRSIVGDDLTLNGRDYTVIGVLPSDFRFRDEADLYLPLGQLDDVALSDRSIHPGWRGVARLKSGVSLAAAQGEMNSIARELAGQYPESNAGRGVTLVPMHDDLVSNIRPTLLLLLGAVGFVLLIACANVANLLLARATARRREFAVRTSLGAVRRRIIRQLLTESVMLAAAAGVVGIVLAFWATRLLLLAIPEDLPRTQEVSMDPYVLVFAVGVSVLTGIVFGIAPAFHGSEANPHDSLREGDRTSGSGRRRAERAFVALQIGLAVVLLAGAGLMIQSIWRLWQVDPGFDTSRLLTTEIALSPTVAEDPSSIRTALRETLTRVASIAGVQSVALTNVIPLSGEDHELGTWVGRGPQPPPDQMSSALVYISTPGYLRVMGISLHNGRFFTDRDTASSTPVVVIDDVMAEHLFPNEDPIGKEISRTVLGPAQIVGVVGHVKHWGLDVDDTARIRDQMYIPLNQVPDQFIRDAIVGANLLLRTETDPLSLVPSVRTEVAGPTEDQPIYRVRTMEQIISRSLAERPSQCCCLSSSLARRWCWPRSVCMP